jgi:hypothetical protein
MSETTQTSWTLLWDKHPEKRITFTKTPKDEELTLIVGEGFQGMDDPMPTVLVTLPSGEKWSMVLNKENAIVTDTPKARDIWTSLLCKGWIRAD